MNDRPLVSAIIPFLNAGPFLAEAIESVFAQTYEHWELLLIDDGASDESTATARQYTSRYPARVRYFEHAGHRNCGKAASRNLGIQRAAGNYIAFLDADDVWLPHKLEQQVGLLSAHPEAAMVYGLSQWWYSWTGRPEDIGRDFVHELGLRPDTLVRPPGLIAPFFLSQEAAIPCPNAILVRREAFDQIGGFEESFTGIYDVYEDQAFYAKVCLRLPVVASEMCCDRYRQHPNSSCSVVERAGEAGVARSFFLNWLAGYLAGQGVQDRAIEQALQQALWSYRHPILRHLVERGRHLMRRTREVPLSITRQLLPASARRWLWAKWHRLEYPPAAGRVRFGSLRRVAPISRDWGYDRGLPIDRYYIEQFLAAHTSDICGHALEVADDTYTRRFGGERVTTSDVLHAEAGNPQATIAGDLTCADHIPSNTFDCVILTQTLQLIYDVRAALHTVYRILKPGGVLLATFPGISPISRYDADRWGYYWGFTAQSARRLFGEVFPDENLRVSAHGNVLAAAALLYGLAAQELRREELDQRDPDYEVIIAVRATKPRQPGE